MRTITVKQQEGKIPYVQAQEIAIQNKFNCYSKPQSEEFTDFETDKEHVFYFSRNGEKLEVVILADNYDPFEEISDNVI